MAALMEYLYKKDGRKQLHPPRGRKTATKKNKAKKKSNAKKSASVPQTDASKSHGKAAIDSLQGDPVAVGCELFSSAVLFEITKQICAQDCEHMELINKMYHGEKISSDDLRDKYQVLSEEDLADPSSPWIGAPVIV